jgi:hypothetical protein
MMIFLLIIYLSLFFIVISILFRKYRPEAQTTVLRQNHSTLTGDFQKNEIGILHAKLLQYRNEYRDV